MPQRWIVTISEDNLEETLKHELIGMPEGRRSLAKRMSPGDTIVLYVGKKRAGYGGPGASVSEFGPVVEVTRPEFHSDVPIWKSRSGEAFPCRVPVSLMSKGKAKAADVVPHLNFVRIKEKWGPYFLTGVRLISEDDYQRLVAAMENR